MQRSTQMSEETNRLSRRNFLRGMLTASGAALLAACGGAAAPAAAPTAAPAPAAEAPTAAPAAAAPTAAPAAAEAPTAAPAAVAPTAAPAAAASGDVKDLTIIWAEWDPSNYLQELVNDYEGVAGVKVKVVQE